MLSPEQLANLRRAVQVSDPANQVAKLTRIADIIDDGLCIPPNRDDPVDERLLNQICGLLAALENEKRKVIRLEEQAKQVQPRKET